jgi:parallel beta-helix repeat protein
LLATFFVLSLFAGIGNAAELSVQEGDSIQEAVNSAVPGDVIIVKPGTYTENILVTTKNGLTISSESGNPEDTIIKSYYPETDVLTIEADNITVRGFTITGATVNCSGICLHRSNNCLIENNKLFDNSYGIYLYSSEKNRIFNNVILKGDRGIFIEESDHNSVESNKVSRCRYGIFVLSSKVNKFFKNTVLDNREYGILFSGSNSNNLSENTASNSMRGIHIGNSDDNKLSKNSIFSNDIYGLFVCPRSDRNLIYNNYFNNTMNIEANNGTDNSYSKPRTRGENIMGGPYTGGNYWAMPNGTGFSETAVDSNGDGIADENYEFETSDYFDPLPLATYIPPDPILPRANMSFNIPEGYAPYSVQFTDLSENETSRSWDFENDGIIDSSDELPVYTYPGPGVYFVNLTVSNDNGTDIQTTTIDVAENSVTDIRYGAGSGKDGADTQSSGQGGISSIPGFEMIYGVFCLLAVFMYKESRE